MVRRVTSVALLLTLAACSRDNERKTAMRSRLTSVASAVEARTFPRPVTRGRAPIAGTFGDAFAAHEAERKALEPGGAAAAECQKTLLDGADETKVTKCSSDLTATRTPASALLDLGRSERAGAPAEVRPMAPLKSGPTVHKSMIALCHHTAAHVALDLREGHASEAATRCAEGLEVGRDYAAGADLVGTSVFEGCVAELEAPCARAITALPENARGPIKADIHAVLDSLPPFGDVADTEFASVETATCGVYLDASERARLGPIGRAAVDKSEKDVQSLPDGERSMHLRLCLDNFEASSLWQKAYHEPESSPERTRLLAEYEKKKESLITGINIASYAAKYDATKATLKKLAE